MADDSSSDEDMPIGQLKAKAKKPDAVVSSSGQARKRISYAEDSDDNGGDSDGDFEEDAKPPAKKRKKTNGNGSKSNGSSAKKSKAASSAKKEKNGKKKSPAAKKSSSAKKKPASKKKTPAKKKSSAAAKKKPAVKKELKKMERAERISHAMQAYLWWNAEDPPKGCQWVKMEHAGVSFPEPYEPHGVKMLYDGEEVDLSPLFWVENIMLVNFRILLTLMFFGANDAPNAPRFLLHTATAAPPSSPPWIPRGCTWEIPKPPPYSSKISWPTSAPCWGRST
jgi:DNA topoisomerase-1